MQTEERRELEVIFQLKKDGTAQINFPRGFHKNLTKLFNLRTQAGRAAFIKCSFMAQDLLLIEAGCKISKDCSKAHHPLPRKSQNSKLSGIDANASAGKG